MCFVWVDIPKSNFYFVFMVVKLMAFHNFCNLRNVVWYKCLEYGKESNYATIKIL
jgi:hypothetical protein